MPGRRLLSAAVAAAAALLLVAGCVGLSWRAELAAVAPPVTQTFPAAQVALGAQLAAAGNCVGCHTAPGGPALAGGMGLQTRFGRIYSSNISPDADTGIGGWSEAAFTRALREGVSRDGHHLFPAFPYTHFTRLHDTDVQALYAYLMTRPPVRAAVPANTLGFPFNVRALQAGWKLLYFDPGVQRDDTTRSATWNRGAYLADGLTHCAACHTPRNRAGAELRDAAYAGAVVDGWEAPALNAANPAPLAWTQQDLLDYLRHGESERHGAAAGAMAAVVHLGLAALPEADIQALAMYFADTNGSADRARQDAASLSQAMARRLADVGRENEPGANLYASACAACHYGAAPEPGGVRGSLALSSSMVSPDPANFIHVVMQGLGGSGTPGPYMPGFAAYLTDADITELAAYLRRTRTDRPAWVELPAAVTRHRPRTP